ncbi:CCR1 [Symbiodinium natans]|uniref:CCR1 protein n=1 Tax=Symbiodinium natans TaxID=878477 RepID=A0A812UGN5_9DINO|nr:CCR1 [Symbiodinium natans]
MKLSLNRLSTVTRHAMSTSGAPWCVTGGSGFLGSWCVKLLLEEGFTVRTTTRSAEKASYLKSLPGAERLTIVDGVDLLTPGAFDDAIRGCSHVLHTASPFYFKGGSEEKLVRPAVEGTRNVLNSCHRLGVKKVALTSSTASVYTNYGSLPADHVYTAEDFSPADVLREKENWYCLSKLLAEQLAWDMSKEPGCPFQLTVLIPTLIWGPMLPGQPHMNTSASSLVGYMDGSLKVIENACKTVVDVRDVSRAHIEAVRGEYGGQRILLIGGCPHFREVAEYVREALPEDLKANVPEELSSELGPTVMGPAPPLPVLYDVSPAERLLGAKFKSAQEQVEAMVQSMLKNGFQRADQYVPDK